MIALVSILTLSIFSKNKKKLNLNFKSNKNLFLFTISVLPILIIFFVSFIFGAKIRTMWMSTFYLSSGIFLFHFFKNKIDLKRINNFLYIFLFIFLTSPTTYLYISLANDSKRTDYPGSEIARLVQNKWDKNFTNEIKIVVGDEWSAGNLSYHLSSRPKWMNSLKNKTSEIDENYGVVYVGNSKILKEICPSVFGIINPVGYCMIGKK